ncbi:MAG: Mth938-like domain-containing protein [Lautropia sp.]|nr:Mth938-like domain-containing protein [Lautropia sp.]
MKLHADRNAHLNTITAYGGDWVEINGSRYRGSLLVSPSGAVRSWPVASFETLDAPALLALADDRPEVILLGTGPRLRFPDPALIRPLARVGIGLEAMDFVAACRTYNILMAEGRRVLAALMRS